MTRQSVIDAIFGSRTAEEVQTARQLRDEWIRLHPGDFGILDAARSLEVRAANLGLPPRAPAPSSVR